MIQTSLINLIMRLFSYKTYIVQIEYFAYYNKQEHYEYLKPENVLNLKSQMF